MRFSIATRAAVVIAALTSLSALPHPARAADPAPNNPIADHEQRIKELEETVERLKKDQQQQEAHPDFQKLLAGWSNGFVLSSDDGAYRLHLGTHTQADGRFFIDDAGNQNVNQFLFRRVRPIMDGTIAQYFNFRVMPDFAGGKTVVFDAYLEAAYLTEARVRVGKFKPPIGLEQLQDDVNLTFAERALPTNLVPNRDTGGQLGGEFLDGALAYRVGIFNGVPDASNADGDVNDDKEFSGRIFALPFKPTSIDPLRGLGVGFSGSYGRSRGNPGTPDLPVLRTFGQATFFSYTSGATPNATNT